MEFHSRDGCIYCNGPHHVSSDVCSSAACLAKYWRRVERHHTNEARQARETAERLEAEAKTEAVAQEAK